MLVTARRAALTAGENFPLIFSLLVTGSCSNLFVWELPVEMGATVDGHHSKSTQWTYPVDQVCLCDFF